MKRYFDLHRRRPPPLNEARLRRLEATPATAPVCSFTFRGGTDVAGVFLFGGAPDPAARLPDRRVYVSLLGDRHDRKCSDRSSVFRRRKRNGNERNWFAAR